eukprot:15485149-Alexandrium_andersonii.AAC.1
MPPAPAGCLPLLPRWLWPRLSLCAYRRPGRRLRVRAPPVPAAAGSQSLRLSTLWPTSRTPLGRPRACV